MSSVSATCATFASPLRLSSFLTKQVFSRFPNEFGYNNSYKEFGYNNYYEFGYVFILLLWYMDTDVTLSGYMIFFLIIFLGLFYESFK